MTPSPACLWSSLLWVWNSVCPLSFKPVSFALWFQDFSQDIMLLGVSLLPLRLTGKWRLLSTLLNPMSSPLGSLNLLSHSAIFAASLFPLPIPWADSYCQSRLAECHREEIWISNCKSLKTDMIVSSFPCLQSLLYFYFIHSSPPAF